MGVDQRRLVVVDLVGGSQPMTRQRGDRVFTIVYNGELYNTIDLRRELEALGHQFLTRNSDTEALLIAYMEWGPSCVERFNGIFAFPFGARPTRPCFWPAAGWASSPFFTPSGAAPSFSARS